MATIPMNSNCVIHSRKWFFLLLVNCKTEVQLIFSTQKNIDRAYVFQYVEMRADRVNYPNIFREFIKLNASSKWCIVSYLAYHSMDNQLNSVLDSLLIVHVLWKESHESNILPAFWANVLKKCWSYICWSDWCKIKWRWEHIEFAFFDFCNNLEP